MWKTLRRLRFLLLNLSGIIYRNTSKVTTQCYSQGVNQQKSVWKFWYLKYFSCGVHFRNTSRLFLATQTSDADIWTTNQNIQKAWHSFVYWYFVNDCVHSFCSCCGIRYPINSLERTSVISTLTASSHLLKGKSLKLYFYRKLHSLSFLLIYSLLGFCWNQRTYEFFPEGHPRRWEVTLSSSFSHLKAISLKMSTSFIAAVVTTVFVDTRLWKKTPTETSKFPSVLRVIDISNRNPPISAC